MLPIPAIDGEAAHGYTLSHIHAIAVHAANRCPWGRDRSLPERAEVARDAIIDQLLASATRPEYGALAATAWKAIGIHTHRVRGQNGDEGAGRGHATYWSPALLRGHDGFSDAVIDRLAFAQIWPTLQESWRQALLALVEHDNSGPEAAAALGIGRDALTDRVAKGRKAFRSLWHQGESVPRRWSYNRPGPRRFEATRALRHRQRQRQRQKEQREGTAQPNTRPGRAPIDLGISNAELLALNTAGTSKAQLARTYNVSHYAIRTRIRRAREQQDATEKDAG